MGESFFFDEVSSQSCVMPFQRPPKRNRDKAEVPGCAILVGTTQNPWIRRLNRSHPRFIYDPDWQ